MFFHKPSFIYAETNASASFIIGRVPKKKPNHFCN
jgi:hypothetical protein